MGIEKPDLVIAGTGAMACLFAARLSAVGIRPMMLGTWVEGVDAINNHGIRLIETNGTEQNFPVRATRKPADCTDADFALVLVKSWQTERVASQLQECLSSTGIVLSLQNGEGNYQTLVRWLGVQRVILGAATLGATLLGPGRVRPGGTGAIILGTHDSIKPFIKWFQKAGLMVEMVADVRSVIWGKLVINAAINPVTALLRISNGELLKRSQARQVMSAAAQEARDVAFALGIQLPFSDPVSAVEKTALRTAENYSSMLQDILRHAPTEIDAICGSIVRAGELMGIPTPVNRTMWLLVKALEESGGNSSKV